MAEIAFTDKWLTVWLGDVLDSLRQMPAESVHMLVTSPPYWGLRDYGVPGQLGLERLHDCLAWARGAELCDECHVCRMVAVFREARRVLRPDGTVWLNYGDSYSGSTMTGGNNGINSSGGEYGFKQKRQFKRINEAYGLKPKDLVGMPWRVAFALQADGWWLRSDIIWHKPNPMPESVTDRPTKSHEYIFLLTKAERYYYDAEAVKESGECTVKRGPALHGDIVSTNGNSGLCRREPTGTRNARTVWTMATQSFKDAHFATFPEDLPRKCILAGTSEKGVCPDCGAPWVRVVEKQSNYEKREETHTPNHKPTKVDSTGWKPPTITEHGWRPSCECGNEDVVPATVLEPFGGSGTTGKVANELGRRAVLIELNPEYVEMLKKRNAQGILC